MEIKKTIEEKMRDILSPIIGSEIEEIDLSVSTGMGPKPGLIRKFPASDTEGGKSINLNTKGGPNQFPEEEDF